MNSPRLWVVIAAVLLGVGVPLTSQAQQQIPWLVDSTQNEGVRDLTMVGSFGLVSVYSGMLVLDFSDPSSPKWVTRLTLPPRWTSPSLTGHFEIIVRDSLAFVPSWDYGFYIVNISDPASPFVISQTYLPNTGRSVSLHGDMALVGGSKFALAYLVDISNPNLPLVVDSTAIFDGGVLDAYVEDTLLFASSGYIYTVNMAIPTSPLLVGRSTPAGSILSFEKVGSKVYCADLYSGVSGMGIFDYVDPTSPQLLGKVQNPSQGDQAIAIHNELAFVGHGEAGLAVVRVSDPTQPTPITCYANGQAELCMDIGSYQCHSIDIYDRYAYVSANIGGLLAFTLDPRGDATLDGVATAADIIAMVDHVFKSGPAPPSTEQADTNCSGTITASDVIILVNHVFRSANVPVCP